MLCGDYLNDTERSSSQKAIREDRASYESDIFNSGGRSTSLVEPNVEVISIVPAYPEHSTRIARDLLVELKAPLIGCLTQNLDIFAWTP